MAELQLRRFKLNLEVRSGRTKLDILVQASSGCYESGFCYFPGWTGYQIERENSLKKIPCTSVSSEEIDKSWPTKEIVANLFNIPNWNGESIRCSLEKMFEHDIDLSVLLPKSRKHMPIYFAIGKRLVAVWEPSAKSILLLDEMSSHSKSFYETTFSNTKRAA